MDADVARAAEYASQLGADAVTDLASALGRPDVVAVAVAVPAADHFSVVEQALEAGKHVFVEKPLALSLPEARVLAQKARARGVTLMVGHLLQYHPAFVRLRELVKEGAIGPVRHVTSNRLNPGAIRTEENALWSLAPHDFSMVLALTGVRPSAVQALATRVVDPAVPDQFAVLMTFPEDVTAQVNVSWLSPFKEHKLTVLGADGALVFDDTGPAGRKLVLYRDYIDRDDGALAFRKGPGEPIRFPEEEPLKAEMAWFLECVQGLRTPRTGAEEAIPVLELLEQASMAAGLGRPAEPAALAGE